MVHMPCVVSGWNVSSNWVPGWGGDHKMHMETIKSNSVSTWRSVMVAELPQGAWKRGRPRVRAVADGVSPGTMSRRIGGTMVQVGVCGACSRR